MHTSVTIVLSILMLFGAVLGCQRDTPIPIATETSSLPTESRPLPAFTMPEPRQITFPANDERMFAALELQDKLIESPPEIQGPQEWTGSDIRWRIPMGWVQQAWAI